MPLARVVVRGSLSGAVGALGWGGLTATTGMEFGAAAWAVGALVGLSVRSGAQRVDAKTAGLTAMALAAAAFVLGKMVYASWPVEGGVARPPLIGSFRWIDVLWAAMALSSAQWLGSRRPSGDAAQQATAEAATRQAKRKERSGQPRSREARWGSY